jgi:hypothetical protein
MNNELDFLYPTQASDKDQWLREMFKNWEKSELPYLCFPFAALALTELRRRVDQNEPFWLYMYYRKSLSSVAFKGQIRFRIHVIQWRESNNPRPKKPCKLFGNQKKIFVHPPFSGKNETARFLCDRFEEIRKQDHKVLYIDDFPAPDGNTGRRLSGRIRGVGIPEVECQVKQISIYHYP